MENFGYDCLCLLVIVMELSRTHMCCNFLINMCLVFVFMFCHKFPKGEIVNVICCKLVTKELYRLFTCKDVMSPCKVFLGPCKVSLESS